jgi:hypothetical protein
MRLIPRTLPERHLLSSLEPEPAKTDQSSEEIDSPFELKGSRIFSGNGRAIFLGILAGGLLISAAGFAFIRHERAKQEAIAIPKLLHVATHSVSASPDTITTPAPMVVQISADLIHVSAIALGHPRLAVINGRSVAEGDSITVHTPSHAVAVTLRVVKIADGRISLTDGTQVITTRLTVPAPAQPERH